MVDKFEKIKDGIIKYKNDGGEYTFWTYDRIVRPYIEKFLKERFPDSLILHEINNIDIIIVIDDHIPVEIQTTIMGSGHHGVAHSYFEKNIEKQIKENIENYDKCWFFFDSEYLRYLQNPNIHRKISINMDWFRKYMKEGKLTVFTVRYDGVVTEVKYKDFDFLSNISMTCKIGYDNDIRILNRNKLIILGKLLKGYCFSQKEIDKFREDWKISDSKMEFKKFLYKHQNERARLFAKIWHCISGYLEAANDILDLNIENVDMKHEMYYTSILGIFEMENRGSNSIAKFVDKFNVCEYFPGYLRNKFTWETLKGKYINGSRLVSIIRRDYDISKGIDYYWN